jgi:prevent-host-death family protein
MKDTYSIAEARAQLPRLVRDVASGVLIRIRRRSETVAYVISRERIEALAETLEILANSDAMKAIKRDRARRGRYVDLDDLDP